MLCIGSFLDRLISLGSAVFVHRHKLSRTKLLVGPDVVSHETQTHNIPDILVKVKQLETDLSVALLGAEDEKKKAEQAAAVARETAIKADRDRAADIEAAIKAAEAAWAATDDTKCEFE